MHAAPCIATGRRSRADGARLALLDACQPGTTKVQWLAAFIEHNLRPRCIAA